MANNDDAHAEVGRAFVSPDSAVFVFPVPADGWTATATQRAAASAPTAYFWEAFWDASYRRPAEYRAHSVILQHAHAPSSGEQLRSWVAAASLKGGTTSECGDISCMIVEAEPALSVTVRSDAVVLKLAPSVRLAALRALRPDSAVLEFYVRAPARGSVAKSYQRVVAVSYP